MKHIDTALPNHTIALGLVLLCCGCESGRELVVDHWGHGLLFDAQGRGVDLTIPQGERIQDRVLRGLDTEASAQRDASLLIAVRALESPSVTQFERVTLKRAVIARIYDANPLALNPRDRELSDAVGQFLNDRYAKEAASVRPAVKAAVSGIAKAAQRWARTYEEVCENLDVPVPPDFALSGSPWIYQGDMTHNILGPAGDPVEIWTYTDPLRRGACIALPRGDRDAIARGLQTPFAGIICQSATNGRACFWDNTVPGTAIRFPWTGGMKIKDMANGTSVSDQCPRCHRGENVFLMGPDDPTWAKILRGQLCGPASNFTTRVESSKQVNEWGRPRYIPVSTSPSPVPNDPNWLNLASQTNKCAATCHEIGAPERNGNQEVLAGAAAINLTMPATCANGKPDPMDCYAPAGGFGCSGSCPKDPDVRCPDASHCAGGSCACDLPDAVVCGSACVTLDSNSNCGACENLCATGAECANGKCVCTDAGTIACDGACVLPDTAKHCGSCQPCPKGAACSNGSCQCPPDTRSCEGRCVDNDSIKHCGSCGNECTDGRVCRYKEGATKASCGCPEDAPFFCSCLMPGTEKSFCTTTEALCQMACT